MLTNFLLLLAMEPGALESALRAAAPAEWRIELKDWTREALPVGVVMFDRRAVPRLPRGGSAELPVVLWRGVLEAPAGRRYPVWARVRIGVERRVIRLRGPVRAGESIAGIDVGSAVEYPLWPLSLAPGDCAGKTARRSLRAGHVLTEADVAPAPAVRRGDEVSVSVKAGAARLTVQARAEANARVGDVVLVKNPLNGRRFAAKVTGAGEASAAL